MAHSTSTARARTRAGRSGTRWRRGACAPLRERVGGLVGADGAPSLRRVTVAPAQRLTPVRKRKESHHRPFFVRVGKLKRRLFLKARRSTRPTPGCERPLGRRTSSALPTRSRSEE